MRRACDLARAIESLSTDSVRALAVELRELLEGLENTAGDVENTDVGLLASS